jgi:hypothetical protein
MKIYVFRQLILWTNMFIVGSYSCKWRSLIVQILLVARLTRVLYELYSIIP